MRIGFDAKRAYHNDTGLGNYSRTLIDSLIAQFPGHQYFLFNPKPSLKYKVPLLPNVQEVLPPTPLYRRFHSLWRSIGLAGDLKKNSIELFHGLSHELPRGIERSGVRSVVTIHDLIFEFYPQLYNPIDVFTYKNKFRHACNQADRIIAISQKTKDDIVERYGIRENKIDVCYQSCDPRFQNRVPDAAKQKVRDKYSLPPQYFLSVGSIIERKNLLNVCKALHAVKKEISVPLVVIGNGRKYKAQVKEYLQKHGLANDVIFLSEKDEAKNDVDFKNSNDFPAIYQMAIAMIYPSFYEGFGLPVLEALWSGIPVITSSVSCLPEAGGPGAFYVDPDKPDEIAAAMLHIAQHQNSLEKVIDAGYQHAQKFTIEQTAKAVMDVYRKTMER